MVLYLLTETLIPLVHEVFFKKKMIKNKQTIHTRHNRRMTTQCPSSLNPPRRFLFKTIDAADQQGSCEWNENSTPSYQYTTKSFNFSMTMSNELAGNKTQYLGLVDNYAIGKFANAWCARRKTFFSSLRNILLLLRSGTNSNYDRRETQRFISPPPPVCILCKRNMRVWVGVVALPS